jgi:hypothetical protein
MASIWDHPNAFASNSQTTTAPVSSTLNTAVAATSGYSGNQRWQPGMPPPPKGTNAYEDYLNYQNGQANAGASASAAGNAAGSSAATNNAAMASYQAGGHWQPGMPAPPPGTVAYQDWVNYGKGQANAGAAAHTAGMAAVGNHDTNVATQQENERNAAGLNMMKPGVNEQFFSEHGGEMTGPGQYQDWFAQHGGNLDQPGMAQKNAAEVLAKYGTGQTVPEADFGAYYDRAAEKATQGLNNQLAARGQYGSGVGLGMIGTQLADLRAQEAKDKADYGLKRSADLRDWTNTVSDIAHTGDVSQLERWNATGQGAGLADATGLARWKAAQQGAESAQDSQRTRGQDMFNNNLGLGAANSGIAGAAYGSAATQDSALLDAINALKMGKGTEGVAGATSAANATAAQQAQLNQLLQAYYASQQPQTPQTRT